MNPDVRVALGRTQACQQSAPLNLQLINNCLVTSVLMNFLVFFNFLCLSSIFGNS